MADGKPDKSWLGPFLRPLRKTFAEMLVMSVFVNMLALVVPVFTMQVYDRVIGSGGISSGISGGTSSMVSVVFSSLLSSKSN